MRKEEMEEAGMDRVELTTAEFNSLYQKVPYNPDSQVTLLYKTFFYFPGKICVGIFFIRLSPFSVDTHAGQMGGQPLQPQPLALETPATPTKGP